MNILQSIFTDYYEHIIYELHPRPAVIENVNKMIHCGDPSHGGAMYGCPHCGNKYNQLRSFHMSCKLVSCVHRHCEMESSYPLVHLFVKLKMKCTPDTKTTKLLLKLFLLWTSSRNWLSTSLKNISKCFATMGYMQNITNRKRNFVNVFLLKNNVSCVLFRIGSTPSFSLSDTTLSVVPNVVLLCWF